MSGFIPEVVYLREPGFSFKRKLFLTSFPGKKERKSIIKLKALIKNLEVFYFGSYF